MIKVKDIMTTELITVSPETEILQAAKILLEERINGIPASQQKKSMGLMFCYQRFEDIFFPHNTHKPAFMQYGNRVKPGIHHQTG